MLFSHEPTRAQLKTIADLHKEFEQANRGVLEREQVDLDQLIYPIPKE
jgi:hypothetical protein